MEQRYILGAAVLLIGAAFILSSAARKAIRSLFYLLGSVSFFLAGVCIYALFSGRDGNQDSAGLLFFVIGALFFGGMSFGAFKYAFGIKAFEISHFGVHDHVSTPIPIPGWMKDISYSVSGIQVYFLFFATRDFYRQNVVATRDVLAFVLIPLTYVALTRVVRMKRPLEGVSRAKESVLFVIAVVLSIMLVIMTGFKVLTSRISFTRSGLEIVERTDRGGYAKGTSLDKDLKNAIVAGDVGSVEKFIDEGAPLEGQVGSHEMPPLLLAMNKRQSRVAEALIRRGAPVGEVELKYAIVSLDARAIRVALSKNKTVPKDCKDCVQSAARLGDADLTAYLLTQLARRDSSGDETYQKALAVLLTMPRWDEDKKTEYAKTYDFLVEKGAKSEVLIDGYLPLFDFASQIHLHADRFSFLKEKGANLNTQDKDGNTYLHFAARGRRDGYDKLLQMGLDPTVKNNAGESPADLIAKKYPSK